MHRKPLQWALALHHPFDAVEAESLRQIEAFVSSFPECFYRTLTIGHVTGSAWLLSRDGGRVLLTHHKKLDKWLQLGGHADGNPDVLAVAVREAQEESGISVIVPVSTAIFDVDVHVIPARSDEPEHRHYDVRFLLQVTGDMAFRVSGESHGLAWVSPDELRRLRTDDSVLRMYRKWLGWLDGF